MNFNSLYTSHIEPVVSQNYSSLMSSSLIYRHLVFVKLHLYGNSTCVGGSTWWKVHSSLNPFPSPLPLWSLHPPSLLSSPFLLTSLYTSHEEKILGVPTMKTVFSMARNGLWFWKKSFLKLIKSKGDWIRNVIIWYFFVLSQYLFL